MSKKKTAKTKKTAKSVAKKVARKVKKAVQRVKKVVRRPAAKPAAPKRKRQSWLDEKSQKPLIEQYARQLGSFMDALADGQVDASEIAAQEARLIKLMKAIEPRLDDDLHAKVTSLLCELTAYDLMHVLYSMHEARPQTTFRG